MKKMYAIICLSILVFLTVKTQAQDESKINIIPGLPENGIDIEVLGENINSEYSDYIPQISTDDKILYFYVKNSPENIGGGDIWYSKNVGGKWTPRVNMGEPLNNLENNYVISIAPDNNSLLLAGKYKKDENGNIVSAGKGISICTKTGNTWGLPEEVVIKEFLNKSEYGEFSLSVNRDILILAVKAKKTIGKKDLYVSFKGDDGKWSAPLNLGNEINSRGQEIAPYLAFDDITLFFSTDGRDGYGSSDIYLSRRLDDTWTKWSEPQNLGPDINTAAFDAYLTVTGSGNYAYFSSKKNSIGGTDIFKMELPKSMKPLTNVVKGVITSVYTGEPISATVVATFEGKEIVQTITDAATGEFEFNLVRNKEYIIKVKADNHLATEKVINLSVAEKEIKLDFNMKTILFNFGDIKFKSGTSQLTKDSYKTLDKLVGLLNSNPGLKLEINGYTDNTGSASTNKTLSKARANACSKYFVTKGISADRLQTTGYGSEDPIVLNDSDKNRAKNRRVEFKAIEN